MPTSDALRAELKGVNLIEASAGTGKTFTIAGLFLRFLLEGRLEIDKVLVVTFTEAATEELRIRIRDRIRSAMRAFRTGDAGDDEVLAYLLDTQEDHARALETLTVALLDFDKSAISTIHGFCSGVLAENAFESGVTFGRALLQDDSSIRRQIMEDFWRKEVHDADALYVDYLAAKEISPASLAGLAREQKGALPLLLVPENEERDEADAKAEKALAKEIRQLLHDLCSKWQAEKADIVACLKAAAENGDLSKQSFKPEQVDVLALELDGFSKAAADTLQLPNAVKNMSPDFLVAKTNKKGTTPTHEFFDLCGTLGAKADLLREHYKRRIIPLKRRAVENLLAEYDRIKKERNVQSFDDLLVDVRTALIGEHGDTLARELRERYPAALIDEFQDTDPVQYEIFRRVYGDSEDTALFLIGDPKQSIYAFRGADIFSYLDARGTAGEGRQYPLGTNWRSEATLVEAINTLFGGSQVQAPFFYDIDYVSVRPSPEGPGTLTLEGGAVPPFRLWFLSRVSQSSPGLPDEKKEEIAEKETKAITKGAVWDVIYDRVSDEVARLVNQGRNGTALIGGEPLQPRDIAILVRSNKQAERFQEFLRRRNIASVLYSTKSLMKSEEVDELHRVFLAIASWRDGSLVKGALVSRLMGVTANELDAMVHDDERWEERVSLFRSYHEIWRERGFMQMFRAFLEQEGVARRLLVLPDGERRMTNVLHAAELLQAQAVERRLGMAGLIKWLADERVNTEEGDDQKQLRLESDEERVKVITIHRVKGLEFPVTFCPFLWDGYFHGGRVYHDRSNGNRLTLDLREELEEDKADLVEEEEFAENLRLAYVSLTRARNLCYTVVGPINDYETSSMAYLLHQGGAKGKPGIKQVAGRVRQMTDNTMRAELDALAAAAPGCIEVSVIPGAGTVSVPRERVAAGDGMAARPFGAKIDDSWCVSSYSGLAGEYGEMPLDEADRDQGDVVENAPAGKDEPSIFTFPRGAVTGNMMHWLFEHLDFSKPDNVPGLVERALRYSRFDPEWQQVMEKMVTDVLATPLVEGEDLTLGSVTNDRKVSEMEFYYPLTRVTSSGLLNIFEKYGRTGTGHAPERIGRLTFSPRRGYMKGFVDLVFEHGGKYYILDYKSNGLGTTRESYRQERLALAMEISNYTLQYHIYSVALHRYLRSRIGNGYSLRDHFGGVFYLFVRGMTPEGGPEFGVFADLRLPELTLVQELSGYFEGGKGKDS